MNQKFARHLVSGLAYSIFLIGVLGCSVHQNGTSLSAASGTSVGSDSRTGPGFTQPGANFESLPPINLQNKSAYPISGVCLGISKVKVIVNQTLEKETDCVDNVWQVTLDLSSIPDQNISIQITYEGSTTPIVPDNIVIDSTAPAARLVQNPDAINSLNVLNHFVSDQDTTEYKYKVGTTSISCQSEVGYSSFKPVSELITDSLSSFSNGTIRLCLLGKDAAGNIQTLADATQIQWMKDTTLPLASISGVPSTLTAQTAVSFAVSGTGVTHYRFKLGLVSQIDCTVATGFSAAYLVSVPITATLSVSGQYKVCAQGKNSNGIWQPINSVVAHTWSIDLLPPLVSGITIIDGDSQYDNTRTPNISWSSVFDLGGSTFSHFQLAIGTTPGASDIVTWTNQGAATSGQITGLNLARGQLFYASVRAFDLLGNQSAPVSGNGFLIHDFLNMNTFELQWDSYGESYFGYKGSFFYVSRAMESGSYDGTYFSQYGVFHVTSQASYDTAETSSTGRYLAFVDGLSDDLSTRGLWVFDSLNKTKIFIGYIDRYSETFKFSENEQKIAYVKMSIDDVPSIWVANVDGTGAVKIGAVSNSRYSSPDYNLELSPDGTKIFYSYRIAGGTYQYFISDTANPNPVEITSVGFPQGNLSTIVSNQNKVIIRVAQAGFVDYVLWSVNWDGTQAVQISGSYTAGRTVEMYSISPDWSKVYFISDRGTNDIMELYSVNTDGTSLTKLNGAIGATADVSTSNFFYSDNNSVAFTMDKDIDAVNECYVYNRIGSSLTKAHSNLASGGSCRYLEKSSTSPSDRWGFLLKTSAAAATELYSVKSDGTGSTKISAALSAGEFVDEAIQSRQGNFVIYRVTDGTDSYGKLYRVNLDGTNHTFLGNTEGSWYMEDITYNDAYLIFESYGTDNGGGEPGLLNTQDGSIFNRVLVGDGDNQIKNLLINSFNGQAILVDSCTIKTNIAGTLVDLIPWKVTGGCVGGISSFKVNETTGDIFVAADLETDGKTELFVIAGGSSTTKKKLNATVQGSISSFAYSSNYQHLVYVGDSVTAGQKEFWYVNLSVASPTPVKLASAMLTSATLVGLFVRDQGDFAIGRGNLDNPALYEVFKINLNTGVRTKISSSIVSDNYYGLSYYSPTPSFSSLVISGEYQKKGELQLSRVNPVTGSSVLLSGSLIVSTGVQSNFNSTQSRILFSARSSASDSVYKVYCAKLDGSGLYEVTANFAGESANSYNQYSWIDNNYILFYAPALHPTKYELVKVNCEGTEFLKLNEGNSNTTDLTFKLFQEKNSVVFMSDNQDALGTQLYASDLSSGVSRKISHTLSPHQKITFFNTVPEKGLVVYRVINLDLKNPEWYVYDFNSGQTRKLFTGIEDQGYIIGDFVFNNLFTKGVLSLYQGSSFKLHVLSF
jgi:hypothetical protein